MLLALLLLLCSPETERLLLGPSPFFRHEGAERARLAGDVALLQKAARSSKWDARRCAAEALGARTPPELLRDPVAVVREAAVRALDLAAPEPVLVALLKDEDDAVRAAAAWALRGARSKQPLRPLLRDPAPAVRIAALAASRRFAELKAMVAKGPLGAAVPAFAALGRAGGAGEAAWLVKRLQAQLRKKRKIQMPLYLQAAPVSDVALARAVGDMARRGVAPGGRSLATHLRKVIEKAPKTGATWTILAEAVAGARDAEAARVLLDGQLRHRARSTLPNVYLDIGVADVLHAFSREPWPELAPLLLPFLDHKQPLVRVAMARALSGDAARPALRDPHPAVRAAACARVRNTKALLGMIRDESPAVVVAATRELGRLADPKAVPALEWLLEHEAERVRRAAVGAFLRVAAPARVETLYRTALRDEAASVRAAAGAALDFLEADETVLPRAIGDLGHEQLAVRENAFALIRMLTAARFPFDPLRPEAGRAQWEDWWKRRTGRERPTDGFRYHVEDLRRRGIDLVLAMDATGSMAPVIQATKRRIEAVVARLRDVVPDLRVRIVAYRDAADVFVTLGSALTHDPRTLEDFLACIPAAGGGDHPEGVLQGLRQAIAQTPWRAGTHRIVLLFGDAPYHERDEPLVRAALEEFKGTVHAVDVGGYGAGGQGLVNRAFRRVAEWGRGAAIGLTEEEELLKEILVLTLGPQFKAAVEALFGL